MVTTTPPTKAGKIGLVAGWGDFPIRVAEALIRQGKEVYCLGIHDHADPKLRSICTRYREFGIGRMGAQTRWFRRMGVTQATMAGKIFKTMIFQRKLNLIRHLPDWTFIKHFYPVLVTGEKDRRDDTLLTTVTELYAAGGICFAPATDFAPELLVKKGLLTRRSPSKSELKDIQFGWEMAKEMGRLDIGQTVAVKNQAVMAVEAIEGTDACIRRAGELCAGGFTLVKVAKPHQDMRFDVPTIGVGTIQTMHDAGGTALAIEADKTIVVDHDQTVSLAEKLGIAIVAMNSEQMQVRNVA